MIPAGGLEIDSSVEFIDMTPPSINGKKIKESHVESYLVDQVSLRSFEDFSSPSAPKSVQDNIPAKHIALPYDEAVEFLFHQALESHCHGRAPKSIPVLFTFDNVKDFDSSGFDADDASQVIALIEDKVKGMISAVFSDKQRKRPMAIEQLVDVLKNTSPASVNRFHLHSICYQCTDCSHEYASIKQFPINYLECGYLWGGGGGEQKSFNNDNIHKNSEFYGIDRCSHCYQDWIVRSVTDQIMAMWKLMSWSGSQASAEQLETNVDWTLNFTDCSGQRVCLWCVDWINPQNNDIKRASAAASSQKNQIAPFMSRHSYTSAVDVPMVPETRRANLLFQENERLRWQNHRHEETISLLLSHLSAANSPHLPPKSRKAVDDCAADYKDILPTASVAPKLARHSVNPDTMSDRHVAVQTEADQRLEELFDVYEKNPPDYMLAETIKATKQMDAQQRLFDDNHKKKKINFTAEAANLGVIRPGCVKKRGGGDNVQGNAQYYGLISKRQNQVFTCTFTVDEVPHKVDFIYIQFLKKAKPVIVGSDTYNQWEKDRDIRRENGTKNYDLLTYRVNSMQSHMIKKIISSSNGLYTDRNLVPDERKSILNVKINGVSVEWDWVSSTINDPDNGIDNFCSRLPDLPPMSYMSSTTAKMMSKMFIPGAANNNNNKKRSVDQKDESCDGDGNLAPLPSMMMFGAPTVSDAFSNRGRGRGRGGSSRSTTKTTADVKSRLIAKTKAPGLSSFSGKSSSSVYALGRPGRL
jgi:hypothetical protein